MAEAVNPASLENAQIEYANSAQLSVIYALADSLLVKARNQQGSLFSESTTVKYDPDHDIASYTYDRYSAQGFHPGIKVQSTEATEAKLDISIFVTQLTPEGRHVTERSMVISNTGVCYGSRVSENDIDGTNPRFTGYTYNRSQNSYLKVPKVFADDTEKLIEMIWTPSEKKHSIWRRILMS